MLEGSGNKKVCHIVKARREQFRAIKAGDAVDQKTKNIMKASDEYEKRRTEDITIDEHKTRVSGLMFRKRDGS